MPRLTDGHSESTRKYGRMFVYYHRLIHDGRKRRAHCRPDIWGNWVELEMSNDPPVEYICPHCEHFNALKGNGAQVHTKNRVPK